MNQKSSESPRNVNQIVYASLTVWDWVGRGSPICCLLNFQRETQRFDQVSTPLRRLVAIVFAGCGPLWPTGAPPHARQWISVTDGSQAMLLISLTIPYLKLASQSLTCIPGISTVNSNNINNLQRTTRSESDRVDLGDSSEGPILEDIWGAFWFVDGWFSQAPNFFIQLNLFRNPFGFIVEPEPKDQNANQKFQSTRHASALRQRYWIFFFSTDLCSRLFAC